MKIRIKNKKYIGQCNALSYLFYKRIFKTNIFEDLEYLRKSLVNISEDNAKEEDIRKFYEIIVRLIYALIYTKNQDIEDFEEIALNTIKEQGFDYSVNASIGNFEFPTKHYGDISLPAGYYDALKVEIGKAKGQNWWCVMFPPLCFTDVSSGVVPQESKEDLENSLTDEEFSIVSDNDNNFSFKLKFKILEILNDTGLITAKK